MIVELIGTILACGGTAVGGIATYFELKKKKHVQDQWGAYPWLCMDNGCFECPKCYGGDKNKDQPAYCECTEYPKDHFHFECKDCGYKTLMRTIDDP